MRDSLLPMFGATVGRDVQINKLVKTQHASHESHTCLTFS